MARVHRKVSASESWEDRLAMVERIILRATLVGLTISELAKLVVQAIRVW